MAPTREGNVNDATRVPIDPRQREEVALRAMAAYERTRERAFRHRLTVAAMLGLPAVLALAWLALVGSQRHVLEIRVGDGGLRLVSHEGPYILDVPGARDMMDFVSGGIGATIRDQREGTSIEPVSYDWASYARSSQVIHREPGDTFPMDFVINGRPFRLAGSELQLAGRRWLIAPGRTIEINVDILPRPVAVSPDVPAAPTADDDIPLD